ncbi:MAG: NAD(P)/FAD-dependent oxidoreductase [Deltaproteobacteria bacterium]|nr:NAD(P)/FAD-dependent oxidoreductase [Deltaproteobacteria bacterium]
MDLFSPLEIRKVLFKNRTVMAPMVLNCAGTDGSITGEFKDFYTARARGGVGYIVLGGTYVHNDGRGFGRQLGIDKDSLVPGLADLASTIRQDAQLGVQLSFKSVGRFPETFSLSKIRSYRRAFVQAARRAMQAGFTAVELHACHDYWLNFFLSPYFNHRTDLYGGSLENRFRLLGEIAEEIVSAVGQKILVGVRLSMTDFMDGGLGLDETLEIGCRLEAIGVDYLSASAGIGLTQFRMSPPSDVPRGRLLVYGRALQQRVRIPVIGVGRLDRPAVFREAVEGGHVSFVAAARAFIADPEYAAKIEQGREDQIRPCLACNYCLTCLHQGSALRCTVNPYVGRDLIRPEPLAKPLRVLVVGGGPAGLTAATTAAMKGAEVRLIDKGAALGGTLNIARRPPFKEPIGDLASYLETQARSAGVSVGLQQAFNPQVAAGDAPDEVVVATGSLPWAPECVCMDDSRVVTAEKVLQMESIRPGRYLVIGGGLVGLETAEYLAERNAEVTVLEMLDRMGSGLGPMRLALMMNRLIKAGVNMIVKALVISVRDGWVDVDLAGREVRLGPYEAVVAAVGYRCNPLRDPMASEGKRVRIVGDANRPRSIFEAIQEGFEAGMGIGS